MRQADVRAAPDGDKPLRFGKDTRAAARAEPGATGDHSGPAAPRSGAGGGEVSDGGGGVGDA